MRARSDCVGGGPGWQDFIDPDAASSVRTGRDGDAAEDVPETAEPADNDDMADDLPTSDPIDMSGPFTGNADD